MIELMTRYGYLAVFFGVLADQIGVPMPSMLLLVAASALAGLGQLNFALIIVLAAAAGVSVGGRIVTPLGRGIANVRLTLTDSKGASRTAATNPFGYYRFDDVEVGATYILTAAGKRYTFSQPAQLLYVTDATDQVNFTSELEKRTRIF